LLVTLALNRPGIRGTPFIPAIIVSAWYGGLVPGLFAVGLSLLSMHQFILGPRGSFRSLTLDDGWYLLVFALSALLVAWITGRQRRTKAELQKAHDDLKARIGDLAWQTRGYRPRPSSAGGCRRRPTSRPASSI